MDCLLIHILSGLAVYPLALAYWCLYWYIQPVDPNSLKLNFDVVTGKPLPRKARRIEYTGFVGALILVITWAYLGKHYAKSPILGTDLLYVFNWSESALYGYLFFWLFGVIGLVFFARHTAKVLVSRTKWQDDERRGY